MRLTVFMILLELNMHFSTVGVYQQVLAITSTEKLLVEAYASYASYASLASWDRLPARVWATFGLPARVWATFGLIPSQDRLLRPESGPRPPT